MAWYVFEKVFKIDKAEFEKAKEKIRGRSDNIENFKEAKLVKNRLVKRGGCWKGYELKTMVNNISIHFMIPFMIFYFGYSLFMEEETPYKIAKKVKNDLWVLLYFSLVNFYRQII